MSSSYLSSGRTNQKHRTRQSLIEAAQQLLARGETPTVEQAAALALVSRPTAYRYFPNQQSLLMAAHPQLSMATLLPENAPNDARARLDLVARAICTSLVENETALRAMFRITLEEHDKKTKAPALRTGRRIGWVEDALAPLRETMDPERFRTLTIQIASTLGIEVFAWLVDVARVSRTQAVEIQRTNALQLLEANL